MAATETSDREIRIERLYDAPREAVWSAWADLAQVAQWWGPRGFTITTHAKDLRPGGIWHHTMHGPDGTDYPNKTLYHEVEHGAKLVYDHGGNDERAPLFRVRALFSDVGEKTKLDMTMTLPSAQAAAETRRFIRQAGGESTWDRLGEYLERHLHGREVFIIDRSFSTSIEHMFELWTTPKHLAQWLPPTGFTMEFLSVDIRTGGSSFYRMGNGKDTTMYGRAQYQEVRRPDRIVYTQEFCDEHGTLSRHPHAPTWPATMLTVVTLSAEGADHTRVSIRWAPEGETTAEELAVFCGARAGMTQGWTGSFDKLEAMLT